MTIDRPSSIKTGHVTGLRSEDVKQQLSAVQSIFTDAQCKLDEESRASCASCGKHHSIKDYRTRTVDNLCSRVMVHCARFTCKQCGLAVPPWWYPIQANS